MFHQKFTSQTQVLNLFYNNNNFGCKIFILDNLILTKCVVQIKLIKLEITTSSCNSETILSAKSDPNLSEQLIRESSLNLMAASGSAENHSRNNILRNWLLPTKKVKLNK
jgi:hypothetical protein